MKCKNALFFLPFSALWAEGFADLAHATLVPLQVGTQLMGVTFLIVGAVLFLTSFSYWKAYRVAPVFMPLHKVITTIILSIICLVIGYLNRPTVLSHIKPNNQAIKEAIKEIPSPLKKSSR